VLDPTSGAAVAEAFGLPTGPGRPLLQGPVARGEQGQVWRLATGGGAYAVKDPFVDVDAAEALADAAYQDAVHAAGVPMPGVVRTPDGAVLVEVGGATVRVYDWVDVLDRDRRLDPAEIGRLFAQIHSVVVPSDEPMDPWYVEPVGADRWHELVEELHRGQAPFAAELELLVPDLVAVEELLYPVAATQWCHLDLWTDNILRAGRGGRAASSPGVTDGLVVLDWENSGPGAPGQELGLALFDVGLGEPDRMAALYTSYVDAGGPGRLVEPSDLAVVVAQLGHIGEMGCRRWLASATEADRRHNEAWVREFVDEPLTLREVEQIVAAVSSPPRT
jgi:hypothetical protein